MAIDDLWRLKDGTPSRRDGRGKRYRVRVEGYPSTLHRTRKEAELVNTERITAGPPTPKSTVTVNQLLDEWLASKARLKPKSVEAAEDAAVAVRAKWGNMLAADVDSADVQAWLNAEPCSPSRLHKLSQCLGGCMTIAVRRKVIDQSPCANLTLPAEEAHEPIYLSTKQVAAIASNAHGWGRDRRLESRLDAYWSPMIWFMATTAVRIGECCALDVGSITRRTVRGKKVWRVRVVVSKTEKPRDVPVSAEMIALLDLERPASDPLFVTPLGHRVLKDSFRARVWQRALTAAKLDDIGLRIHDLRHTAISWAIADGADIKMVQLMAGHRSAKTTLDVYGHLWEGGLDDISALMGKRVARRN